MYSEMIGRSTGTPSSLCGTSRSLGIYGREIGISAAIFENEA